jgi:hypothetical protein
MRADFDHRYDLSLYDKMSRWFYGTSDTDTYQAPAIQPVIPLIPSWLPSTVRL